MEGDLRKEVIAEHPASDGDRLLPRRAPPAELPGDGQRTHTGFNAGSARDRDRLGHRPARSRPVKGSREEGLSERWPNQPAGQEGRRRKRSIVPHAISACAVKATFNEHHGVDHRVRDGQCDRPGRRHGGQDSISKALARELPSPRRWPASSRWPPRRGTTGVRR